MSDPLKPEDQPTLAEGATTAADAPTRVRDATTISDGAVTFAETTVGSGSPSMTVTDPARPGQDRLPAVGVFAPRGAADELRREVRLRAVAGVGRPRVVDLRRRANGKALNPNAASRMSREQVGEALLQLYRDTRNTVRGAEWERQLRN